MSVAENLIDDLRQQLLDIRAVLVISAEIIVELACETKTVITSRSYPSVRLSRI